MEKDKSILFCVLQSIYIISLFVFSLLCWWLINHHIFRVRPNQFVNLSIFLGCCVDKEFNPRLSFIYEFIAIDYHKRQFIRNYLIFLPVLFQKYWIFFQKIVENLLWNDIEFSIAHTLFNFLENLVPTSL